MRNRLTALVAATALILAGVTANAGSLTSATWAGSFQGTPFTLTTATGGGLTASGASTATSASVNLIVGSTAAGTPCLNFAGPTTCNAPNLSTISTGTPSILVRQTLGGTQAINFGPGGATVNQGVPGGVQVDIAGLTDSAFGDLFTIPLSVGASGMITTSVINPLAGTVVVTVTFLPWQTGLFTFTGTTVGGASSVPVTIGFTPSGAPITTIVPIPTLSTIGSNNLTANGGGSITLIAPSIVKVTVKGAPNSTSAGATRLTLNFVPEPGTLLLLGAGLMGLAAVGRRRA